MPSDICSSGQPPGKLSQLLYKLLLSCYVQLRTASRASLAMLSSSSSVMLSRVMATFSWDRRILSLFLMMVETCLVIRKIFIVTGVGSSAVCLRLLGMISVTPHLYPRPPPLLLLNRSGDAPALGPVSPHPSHNCWVCSLVTAVYWKYQYSWKRRNVSYPRHIPGSCWVWLLFIERILMFSWKRRNVSYTWHIPSYIAVGFLGQW